MNFAVPVDHGGKIIESKMIYNYFDIASEQKKKKLWNMKIIMIVVGALGTVHKGS